MPAPERARASSLNVTCKLRKRCVTYAGMEVFEAVADPTRREILALLRNRELAAGDVAGAFAISRPAISRHLRILRECGLVAWRGDGQRRIYRLRAAPLRDVQAWLDGYREFWSDRLDALAAHVEGQTGG